MSKEFCYDDIQDTIDYIYDYIEPLLENKSSILKTKLMEYIEEFIDTEEELAKIIIIGLMKKLKDQNIKIITVEAKKPPQKEIINFQTLLLDSFDNYERLPEQEKRELIKRAQNGDVDAQNLLICHEGKFIYAIAKKIFKRRQFHLKSIDLYDLFDEGIFGFKKAIDNFDLGRGTKFSNFAGKIIERTITKAIREKYEQIKLPEEIYYKKLKIYYAEINFVTESGRKPTITELSSLTGLSEEQIEYIKNIPNTIFSIDEKVKTNSKGDDLYYIDTLTESNSLYSDENQDICNHIMTTELIEKTSLLLDSFLDIEEQEMIIDREINGLTFGEIGIKYNKGSKQNAERTLKKMYGILKPYAIREGMHSFIN